MLAKRIISAVTSLSLIASTSVFFAGCSAEEWFGAESETSSDNVKSDSSPKQENNTNSNPTGLIYQDPNENAVADALSDGIVSNDEFLGLVNDSFGMEVDEDDDNGELNAAKEWGIVEENETINSDEPVSKEFIVTSLMRAAGYADENSSPEEVLEKAKECGIVNDSFDDISDNIEDFPQIINDVQKSWANQTFEQHTELTLADEVANMTDTVSASDVKINGDIVNMPSEYVDGLDVDSVYILPKDVGGDKGGAYKIISIKQNSDGTSDIKSVPATIDEVYAECKCSGNYTFDPASVEAVGDDVSVDFQDGGSAQNVSNSDISQQGMIKQLSFDEEPQIQQLDTGAKDITFTKKLGENTDLSVAVKGINLRTDVDWNIKKGLPPKLNINKIYMALDYTTEVSVKTGFDFETNVFDEDKLLAKKYISEPSLEIGKFVVSICPGLSVNFRVNVIFEASGEIKVTVTTNNTKGFEMKGSSIRTINDTNTSLDVKLSGKIGIYPAFTVALSLEYIIGRADLFSLTLAVGPTLEAELNFHAELDKEKEKLICTDINGYLTIRISVGFPELITKMLGVDSSKTLYENDKDSSPFKWHMHLENFKIVDACTLEQEEATEEATQETTASSGVLELEISYKSIEVGNSIALGIKSIPSGYSNEDIVWVSDAPSKVSVDQSGNVSAVSAGAATITATTSDGKYSVSCTINATDISKTADFGNISFEKTPDVIAA